MGPAMDAVTRQVIRFDGYTLDLLRGRLQNGSSDVELRPKSFEVLRYLAENAGRVVSRDELLQAIWPNVFVTDTSLTQCISEVRNAVGDSQHRVIKTVPRRGYLFVMPAEAPDEALALDGMDNSAAFTSTKLSARLDRVVGRRGLWFTCLVVLLLIGSLAAGVWAWRHPAGLPVPERPSIAVVPFANMSGDAQYEFFSDGISEDLTTGLSRFPELFVIARASAYQYKGSQLQPKQIGRELGVRYLLYGSIRRQVDRLRINVQLVDAENGSQLWAEHDDRSVDEIFAVHDELIEKIVGTLLAHIAKSEINRTLRKRPGNVVAYENFLRGNAVFRNVTVGPRGEILARSRALYEQAIAADPNYAPAIQALANNYVFAYLEPTEVEPIKSEYGQQAVLERALELARQAIELDPSLPEAHATLAWALHWRYRRSEALAAFERAFALNPNLADGRYSLILTHSGRATEGIQVMQKFMRLDPFHSPIYFGWLGNAQYLLGQYDAAYQTLSVVASRQPQHRPTQVWFAAAAAQVDRHDKAKMAAARVI
jgi:adenylate cyclase